MARLKNLNEMFAAHPRSPEPVTLAYRMVVTLREYELSQRMGRDEFAKMVRQEMGYKLGREIAEKCAPFTLPDEFYPGQTIVEMEITLNDRGSYEHMLPAAFDRGETKGFKRGRDVQRREDIETLPYGMNPDEVYE